MTAQNQPKNRWVIPRDDIQILIDALVNRGYDVLGPVERAQAVVYRKITSVGELPIGLVDEQDGGHYRLTEGDGKSLFAYVVGPNSWKQFLHEPAIKLFTANRDGNSFTVHQDNEVPPKLAFFGIRACELHAIGVQDRVFLDGEHVDPHYKARRERIFTVAVNCARAGGTCFCSSMNTGPKATDGFDLSLTEVADETDHYFIVEAGSDQGLEVLRDVPHQNADTDQTGRADAIVAETERSMGRTLDTDGLKEILYSNLEHPRWDNAAERCLACGNCTMVCPTCFCTSVEDVTDLTGTQVERWRKWDSCFTGDFTYIHGGSVRASHKARYRQWMTHKLASWIDQFGTSGCVGCGRCITWCPVGIDITEEVAAIRAPSDTPGEQDGQSNA